MIWSRDLMTPTCARTTYCDCVIFYKCDRRPWWMRLILNMCLLLYSCTSVYILMFITAMISEKKTIFGKKIVSTQHSSILAASTFCIFTHFQEYWKNIGRTDLQIIAWIGQKFCCAGRGPHKNCWFDPAMWSCGGRPVYRKLLAWQRKGDAHEIWGWSRGV